MIRVIDLILAIFFLVLTIPVFLVLMFVSSLSMGTPIFFKQLRVGKNMTDFPIYKFRTLSKTTGELGIDELEAEVLPSWGKFLRRSRLNELPQLLNILLGHMSFVGTRPQLKRYVEAYRSEYQSILKRRPGFFSYSLLAYYNEGRILAMQDHPEKYYLQQMLPRKLELDQQMTEEFSLKVYLTTLFRGLALLIKVGLNKN